MNAIPHPLKPDSLRALGESIYGTQWQSALARDLLVTPQAVRAWLASKAQVPGPAVAYLRLRMADEAEKRRRANAAALRAILA